MKVLEDLMESVRYMQAELDVVGYDGKESARLRRVRATTMSMAATLAVALRQAGGTAGLEEGGRM